MFSYKFRFFKDGKIVSLMLIIAIMIIYDPSIIDVDLFIQMN